MRRGRFSEITILAEIPLYSKTLARPGVGGKPRAAGKVFRNHNTGRNCALFIRFAQLCLAGKGVQRPRGLASTAPAQRITPKRPSQAAPGKGGSETSRARIHHACAVDRQLALPWLQHMLLGGDPALAMVATVAMVAMVAMKRWHRLQLAPPTFTRQKSG